MKLGFFTMPIHPLDRDYTQTLKEDRETIILADKLGFYDAFVGEHLADAAETITNSMLFLATLIHSTERIKLATGTTNLSHNHPVLVATHAAMFDHLTEGRFIFGISPGTLRSDREAVGILDDDHNKIFADCIEVILAIWEREAPYKIDFPDNRFKVTTETSFDAEFGVGIMQKPLQKPHPEIVGTVVAPFSKGVIAMGERNFHPLSANFLLNKWVSSHWANYSQGCTNIGKTPDPSEWRIARTIFVADDDKVAVEYGKTNHNSPFRFYYNQLYTKLKRGGRHAVFKYDRDEPDEALSLDRIVDDLVICGTVNNVVDQILAFREEVGDFGELVLAGMDWVDGDLTKRSMQLMAEEVMPRVNEAIGSSDTIASAAESTMAQPSQGLDIPVVDIGGYETGGPETRRKIAAEVAQAVETIGFLTIAGHGVPTDLMDAMRDKFRAFYDLPMDEKRKSVHPANNLNRGYSPPGVQNVASTDDGIARPDLREAYPFGRIDLPDDPYYRAADAAYAYETNIWPEAVPGFKETTKKYYQALEDLNQLMLRIFATALDLDEDFFMDKFDRHASVLRGMNYFDQTDDPIPGQLRCAAHADYGTHTFLQIENAPGGLQVLNRAGDWIDVDPAPGTFVVNIGDLMMNWTNDRWLSNQHRVVNPPAGQRHGTRRQSIAYFVQPNYDALIECIETCKSPGEPARHPPVRAWEHRYAKLNDTMAKV